MADQPLKRPTPIRVFAPEAERRRAVDIIGARSGGFADAYHALIKTSWPRLFLAVALVFLGINAVFGCAYWAVGGIANARSTSFLDHFFFSVHTFGTIGYGSMYPTTTPSELVMTLEALSSLFLTAVMTGLAFAKFARPTARVLWSNVAVVSDREGVPTLMIRMANERRNHVVDASLRLSVLRNEVTREGERVRRFVDLPLVRASSPSFLLTWTVMHQITRDSPLYRATVESLTAESAEMVMTMTGLDEVLSQTVHARHSYIPHEVVFGARYADVIAPRKADGKAVLDFRKFHDTLPAKLTWPEQG